MDPKNRWLNSSCASPPGDDPAPPRPVTTPAHRRPVNPQDSLGLCLFLLFRWENLTRAASVAMLGIWRVIWAPGVATSTSSRSPARAVAPADLLDARTLARTNRARLRAINLLLHVPVP